MFSNPIVGMAVIGAIIALILVLAGNVIGWFFNIYTRIFRTGLRSNWKSWGAGKRLLFLLGLSFWLMLIPVMFAFHIVFLVCFFYLGAVIVRKILF